MSDFKNEIQKRFNNDFSNVDDFLENVLRPIFGDSTPGFSVLTDDPEIKEKASRVNIESISHKATFTLGDADVKFFEVVLNDNSNIQSSRVGIQDIIRRYTEQFGCSLMVFHYANPKNRSWRFSYVEKRTSLKDSTPAKRYTYMFGEGYPCKTATERFDILKNKNGNLFIKDLTDAFAVEPLSDEFFHKYLGFYSCFVEYLAQHPSEKSDLKYSEMQAVIKWFRGLNLRDNKNQIEQFKKLGDDEKAVRDYVKKMMGRLVFLQFLQKKRWMGVPLGQDWKRKNGDVNFLYNLFKKSTSEQKENFLESVLEPIFFECLNSDRRDDDDKFDTKVKDIGENGWVRIPYLNGGLFKEEEEDTTKIKFPAILFERLFEFFNEYNFTIDESDTSDVQVGIAPEMLSKIFENLLEDNKDKGAFYTPKEIVNYMCKESLIQYLVTEIKDEKENENLREFVENPYSNFEKIEKNKDKILNSLKKVKICDPAVGSGAFPMGLLQLLFECRVALGDTLDKSQIKQEIVKNNIYGVDIEKGAVDIARLRFWLSIVIEEDEPRALPNLDYKIMQGNSLIESYTCDYEENVSIKNTKGRTKTETIDLSKITTKATIFDDDKDVKELEEALKGYYEPDNETAHKKILQMLKIVKEVNENEKDAIKRGIKDKVLEIISKRGFAGGDKIINKFKEINIDANTDFFLWHTWFSEVFNRASDCDSDSHSELVSESNSGFDIVIGNPPYISAPTQSASENLIRQREQLANSGYYETLYQKWDLYIPFMEKSLRLLSKGGSFAMIVPYPLSNQLYGKLFREWVLKNYDVSEITDLNGTKVFENATVSNLILFATATEPKGRTKISHINESKEIKVDFVQNESDLVQDEKTKVWNLTQEKRETNRHADMHVLGDYCYITEGMKLNANEKTARGEFIKEDLISKTKDKIHCREYIEGKDIDKYVIKRIQYLEYDTERVPNKLRRPTFREIYNSPKLMFNILGNMKVIVDDKNNFLHSTSILSAILWHDLHGVENKSISNSIKKFSKMSRQEMEKLSKTVSLKYLLGIMNSKYASVLLANQRGDDYHIYAEHIRNIPISQATKKQQTEIIEFVDKILATKKSNPNADTSALEKQIDALVYKLYNLTDEESPLWKNEFSTINCQF